MNPNTEKNSNRRALFALLLVVFLSFITVLSVPVYVTSSQEEQQEALKAKERDLIEKMKEEEHR